MSKRGRVCYVPGKVMEELEIIKNAKQIQGIKWRHSAFKELVNYSRVGQEAERIRDKMTLRDVFRKHDAYEKARKKRK